MSDNKEATAVVLARIDERMKAMSAQINAMSVQMNVLSTTVEELKSFRWKLLGACSVLGIVFGFIAKSL